MAYLEASIGPGMVFGALVAAPEDEKGSGGTTPEGGTPPWGGIAGLLACDARGEVAMYRPGGGREVVRAAPEDGTPKEARARIGCGVVFDGQAKPTGEAFF